MSERAKHVLAALLELPDDERRYVFERGGAYAGDGADEELSQEEWDAAWEAEIKRRVEALRTGKVKTIPGDEVMARLREKYG